MSNFFNAIGVADMEKVHSAVIGWILSDKCCAFNINQKSSILCKMFGLVNPREYKTINVFVETYDIDILIETVDKLGQSECWIIENKVKSNQHDNQLDKYVDIIQGKEMTKGKNPQQICTKYLNIPDTNQHYCFLTLITEQPRGNYAKKWTNIKYDAFCSILSTFSNSMNAHIDSEIIKEYTTCISKMAQVLVDFLKTPNNYPNVFTDGSKKKTQKNMTMIATYKGGQDAIYIAENGLETIFQKCYMGIIANGIMANGIQYPYEIKETHGNAMLNIDVTNSICWNKVRSKYPNNNLQAGIEFQNGTLKIQIHDMGNINKTSIGYFNNNWIIAFQIASNSSKNINPSKNNGRYYVSKTLWKKSDWWVNAINWKVTIRNCITELQDAVNHHP